ncbi:hypothetical protein ACKI1H_27295 [Pseudomonas sp. YH-1]|uniref:hypothetical protein n=1 Tax=Pseudomonas sp. YH-1 TaxID=3384787 RepID=UPI003F7EA541
MTEQFRYCSYFTSHPENWQPCSKEHHDMVKAHPHEWPGYEVRTLAAVPGDSPPAASGYDQLWQWFGLSYSAYAVLPRVMMHAMPDDWQGRMAALLDEWIAAWPNQPDISAHIQIKQANRFIKTPEWLLNYRHPDQAQLERMRAAKA